MDPATVCVPAGQIALPWYVHIAAGHTRSSSRVTGREVCPAPCASACNFASVGCNACDGEGDCADCDQEYVLFADRCEPRASSPWVAPEPGGAAEPVPSSPSPPLWFGRHPHSGESETNRPNHVPTEDDGAATEAARQQLHQLVGDLRGMVQEEPALRERLRDKHGFMVG